MEQPGRSIVTSLVDRGAADVSVYVDDLFRKLSGSALSSELQDSFFAKSFDCTFCASRYQESVTSYRDQHTDFIVLPALGYTGTRTVLATVGALKIFSYQDGPIIPVLTSMQDLVQTKELILKLYRLNFNQTISN